MARGIERLTAMAVDKLAKKPGVHGDGGGLYLRVSSLTARSWVFRFMMQRRAHEMGLGPYPEITLAEAREMAAEARRLKARRQNPLQARRDSQTAARLEDAKSVTFRNAAEQFIRSHEKGWKNSKHGSQWAATLATYAYPTFGDLPVAAIDTGLVMQVLEPIWAEKSETASRVRGRIENILDWARTRGYRPDVPNPARWKGHLDKLLPAKTKVRRVTHHPALPFAEVPAFMTELAERQSISARALEFAILTAARTNEVLGATWAEIDLQNAVWTIAAERMKGGRDHRVPLAAAAIKLLEALPRLNSNPHLFPGRGIKPLSNMAMLELMRGLRPGYVPHGFRSSFRDWAAEKTSHPNHVVEQALAHSISDKVEAAYRRGDLFDKRRHLMEAWASYCLDRLP
jgi:integrase